ncbi:MAG: Transcriptional regulator, TetR family [Acidimicrobiales bacterium]|nr:Transcriptional regulator, TetR family [Acidimicrobiales bacterium]
MTTDRAPTKRGYRMVARAQAAAETRARVLATAWTHFSERPYEDVRLADIASEAGVTVQTMHSTFGPKEDLFVAVWAWFVGPIGAQRRATSVGDVAAAVHVLYDSYDESGDAVLRLLAQEDRIPAVRQMTDRGRAFHHTWVEHIFAPILSGLAGAQRRRRLAALVVATDLQVWKLLRRDMGLGRTTAERTVIEMVTSMKGAS